ncbi:MAG: peptide chain release factor N(5)-glutamine methyltransferase [Pseudomonadota bacterium]
MNEDAIDAAAMRLKHKGGLRDASKLWDAADGEFQRFEALVAERSKGRPISQLIGYRDFWKDRFTVTSDVLDPRPETEHLVEEVLKQAGATKILELGTGSGCIALSLARDLPDTAITAVDISYDALAVAKSNSRALGLTKRVDWIQSDWFSRVKGRFDIIVSNPPYIAEGDFADLSEEVRDFEPKIALAAGEDGLEAYRSILTKASEYLSGHGRIYFEHGFSQAKQLRALASAMGFERISLVQDLSGHDRVSIYQKKL